MVSSRHAPRPSDEGGGDEDKTPEVLVVDDDPRNLEAIRLVLDRLEVKLTVVRSGENALREVLRTDFAVILLDVKLPGLTGFETAQLIRSRRKSKHVPIIFVTGYKHGHEDVSRGYALGAVDYLLKPIVPEMLRAKVNVFVELSRRAAEIARQSARLREAQRIEAARKLEEERRRWEAAELRWQVQHQRLLNDQLSEMDRRKDDFIAMLAHELRNPLVPLVTGLRLIASRSPADEVILDVRDKMERQVQHLTRLVDDLLDVARITQDKFHLDVERVDLSEVIGRALDLCRVQAEQRGQTIEIVGPGHCVEVDADVVRLAQVVANLLGNASRYSESKTCIRLRWGEEGDRAFIRVEDDGCGIDPSFLDRVFDAFAQARAEGRGLGLGLALVRHLVQLHGGEVHAASDGLGCGSTFTVRVPLASVRPVEAPSARTETSLGTGVVERSPPLRVAIVEDHPDILDLVGRLIESWGHQVVGVAADGGTAVRLLLEAHPDVAIVDIGLPDLNGLEVAQRVVRTLGDARPALVAMSGYGQAQDRQHAAEAGFDTYLVKPPAPDELREALETAPMRRRRYADQPVPQPT